MDRAMIMFIVVWIAGMLIFAGVYGIITICIDIWEQNTGKTLEDVFRTWERKD